MQRYYLVRHGSKKSEGRRYIGITDVPLSDKGRIEAKRIGMWFGRIFGLYFDGSENITGNERPLISIYSSPLSRCVDTAGAIADYCHIDRDDIIIRDGFIEVNMGEWENMPMDEVKDTFTEEYEERGRDIWNYRTPGGEAFKDAGKRFLESLYNIEDDAENVLVTAHVGVIKSALAVMDKEKENNVFGQFMPCGAITVLDRDNDFTIGDVGITPWLVPDEEEIEKLWKKNEVPDNVVKHMKTVASVLDDIAGKIDPDNIIYDRELLNAAALLHDIVRMRKNHPAEGRKVLEEEGYSLLGMICGEHNSPQLHPAFGGALSEEDLLYYADMRVCEDELVSVEERFEKSLAKCKSSEAIENHKKRLDKALYIESIINRTEESAR